MTDFEPTNGAHDSVLTETGLMGVREATRKTLALRRSARGTQVILHGRNSLQTYDPHNPIGANAIMQGILGGKKLEVKAPKQRQS